MYKRIAALLAVTMLLNTGAMFADTQPADVTANLQKPTVTLVAEKVIQNLANTSLDIKIADIDIKIAHKAANDANKAYDASPNKLSLHDAAFKADSAVLDAQQSKQDLLLSLKIKVGRLFTTAFEQKKDIEFAQADVEMAQETLAQAQLKYKNGMVTKDVVDTAEKDFLDKQKNISNLNTQYNNTLVELKKQAGLTMDTPVTLMQYKRPYKYYTLDNPAQFIKDAAAKSYKVAKADRDLRIAQYDYDQVGGGHDAEASSAYATLTEKTANKKDALAQAELDLWTQYNTMENLNDDIKIADIDLQVAELNYQAAQIKHKNGMITDLQMRQEQITYEKAQNAKVSAVNEYMYAVDQFENLLHPVKK